MFSYTDYTNSELQAVTIAKNIKDGQIVIIGTGIPLIGASIAKRYYAPNCHLMVESGMMDIAPPEVPGSVSDLRFMSHCSVQWDNYRYLGLQVNSWQMGTLDLIAFIGGAQIDAYGNVNSTCIGPYNRPKVRFSGSGGANGIATFVNTIITMKHEAGRFVKNIDYITSPGWIDGPEGRKKRGLPENRGPQMVISDLGTFKFNPKTKRMYLNTYFPSTTIEEICKRTEFDLDVSQAVMDEPPSAEIIRIIREEIDPGEIFIKRPKMPVIA